MGYLVLTKGQINECLVFAHEFSNEKNEKSTNRHGNPDHKRSVRDVFLNTLRGKLGEVAVHNYLGNIGISSKLDFSITKGVNNIDTGDVLISFNSKIVKLSVKTTSPFGFWLLVEEFMQVDSADLFVLARVPDIPFDRANAAYISGLSFEYVGFCTKNDFLDSEKVPFFEFSANKNNRLLKRKVVLSLLESAKRDSANPLTKSFLIETFNGMRLDRADIFVDSAIKGGTQFGLPDFMLKRGEKELSDYLAGCGMIGE